MACGVGARNADRCRWRPYRPAAAVGAEHELLFDLCACRASELGSITVLLFVSGHFAGFTYVRPVPRKRRRSSAIEAISLILLAYGIAASRQFAGGLIIERSITAAVSLGTLLIAAMAFALVTFGSLDVVSGRGGDPVGLRVRGAAPSPSRPGWCEPHRPCGKHRRSHRCDLPGRHRQRRCLGGLFVDSFGPLGAITYCAVATLASGLYVMASRRSIAF